MKKTFLLIWILILTLTACTAPGNNGHYTAEFPYDPLQYMTFLKKEIQGIENQLTAAMSHAVMVSRGEYPAEEAASNAKNSLDMIKTSRACVDVMRPPGEYIDTRERSLEVIYRIEDAFADFIAELEKPELDKDRLIEIKNSFHGHSISLASLVNAYWV